MVIGIFLLKFSPMATALLIAIIGIGWEIKDGIKAPDSHGNVQGFSWKDLIADFAGIIGGYLLYLLLA